MCARHFSSDIINKQELEHEFVLIDSGTAAVKLRKQYVTSEQQGKCGMSVVHDVGYIMQCAMHMVMSRDTI